MADENTKSPTALEKLKSMIIEMIEKPKIFTFGDILALPSVKRLQKHQEFKSYYNTLELFTNGNLPRYLELKDSTDFVELTPAMMKKLRYLTLIDIAAKGTCVPYAMLLEKLKIASIRELEDLLIEAMFTGFIEGVMQQAQNRLCITNIATREEERQSVKRSLANDDTGGQRGKKPRLECQAEQAQKQST